MRLLLLSIALLAAPAFADEVACVPTGQVTGHPLLDPRLITALTTPVLNTASVTLVCRDCIEITEARGRREPTVAWKPDPKTCVDDHAAHCKVGYWAALAHTNPRYGACRDFFVDRNGRVGGLSKLLLNQIGDDIRKRKYGSVFLQDFPDLQRICPGFRNMDTWSRVAFFTYLFENLAYRESSCDNKSVNTDPDVPQGMAVCLYQLEPKRATRAWRGPHCDVPDAKFGTEEGCTACAVDTLNSYMRQRDGTVRDRFFGDTYWYSLNPPRKSLSLHSTPKYRDGDQFCMKGKKHATVYDKFVEDITYFPLCYDKPPCEP